MITIKVGQILSKCYIVGENKHHYYLEGSDNQYDIIIPKYHNQQKLNKDDIIDVVIVQIRISRDGVAGAFCRTVGDIHHSDSDSSFE